MPHPLGPLSQRLFMATGTNPLLAMLGGAQPGRYLPLGLLQPCTKFKGTLPEPIAELWFSDSKLFVFRQVINSAVMAVTPRHLADWAHQVVCAQKLVQS